VCDRWFASVPCQTWPNRAFVHAGTSCGRVNNLDKEPDDNTPPDPLHYNTKTIFNVLHELGVTWKVYADNSIPGIPTLTRYEFLTQLASPFLAGHFCGFGQFQKDAAAGKLPSYSFIEPSFLERKNDQHPPHDVSAGDHYLYEIWKAVSQGPGWDHTLLIITYDEHGGCYDHVPPPRTAVRPDGSPPQQPFAFDRYGVRVPAVFVSPWIEAGTVFRTTPGGTEYDHTSILATLRDWQDLANRSGAKWLASARIAKAPIIASVLTRKAPRTDVPAIDEPQLSASAAAPSMDTSLNGHQRTLLAAALRLAPAGLENEAAVAAGRLVTMTAGAALADVKKLLTPDRGLGAAGS
jgi:phospholipase C